MMMPVCVRAADCRSIAGETICTLYKGRPIGQLERAGCCHRTFRQARHNRRGANQADRDNSSQAGSPPLPTRSENAPPIRVAGSSARTMREQRDPSQHQRGAPPCVGWHATPLHLFCPSAGPNCVDGTSEERRQSRGPVCHVVSCMEKIEAHGSASQRLDLTASLSRGVYRHQSRL